MRFEGHIPDDVSILELQAPSQWYFFIPGDRLDYPARDRYRVYFAALHVALTLLGCCE
jgi:hypothetical protein